MAKFDIPGVYDKVPNQYFLDAWDQMAGKNPQDLINYTKNNNEIFIFTNDPEYLTNSHLGDASPARYINRVEVSGKNKMMLYLTHHLERLSGNYTLGIRVYNPSASDSITFIKKHEGYSNSDSWNNPGYAWEDFFTNKGGTTSVNPRESKWLVTKSITATGNSNGSFLDYFGEFEIPNSSSFVIAIYVCKNIANIPDETFVIPWSGVTHSGYSNCYTLTANKTIDINGAFNDPGHSYFYGISNPEEGLGSQSENIPITLAQGQTVNTGLGYYGLPHIMKFNFKNTGTRQLKVKAYLISNSSSHFAGISSLNGCSKFLANHENSDNVPSRWNFYESPVITNSSGTVTIDFTYCHLGLGNRGAILQFEAVEV